jgi:hypothetical protein
MKNFLRFGFVLLFIFWGFDGVGQRKLPYPIILVHGWTGSDETWNKVMEEFQTIGLNVDYNPYRNGGNGGAGDGSRLDFCLNSDFDRDISNIQNDVLSYLNPLLDGNNDVFVINFNNCRVLNLANVDINGSNQSAITKQGSAVGLAVQKVLSITGADKVILMGHSMGGLAIREYLQNSEHWHYQTHKVAKLVTNATPHGGSNSGSPLNTSFAGYDQRSEAVRDMRTTHPSTLIYNQYNGVYLYGGWETISYVHRDATSNAAGLNYRNLDINCNGQEGNFIVGLNERAFYNDIPYANIVGTYFGTSTDQIVSSQSANLNYTYNGISSNDVFVKDVTDAEYLSINNTWHSDLAKQKVLNILALDEPSTSSHAYEIYANATSTKMGLFSRQSNGSSYDTDRYKVYLSRGITKIEVNAYQGSYPSIGFYNPYQNNVANSINTTSANSNTLITANTYTGTHFFDFIGDSGGSWRSYNYSVTNKPPSDLFSNATSTCIGGIINLYTSETGFDSYKWYRNGQYFTTTNTNYLNATTTGVGTTIFTVETYFGSVGLYANNSKQVTTFAPPSPPILTAISLDGTSSTTGLNICNGETIALTTNCASGNTSSWFDGLNTYSNTLSLYYFNATTTTTYTAKCSNYFCNSTNSPPVRIVKEPNIQSTKNGNWQDPTMWTNNYVPLNCQTVTIQTGHTVTVQINDAKAKKIIINGKLNFQNVSPTVKGKVGLGI